MQGDGPESGDGSPKYGRLSLPPKTVSSRWRAAAVVLVVLLAIVAVLPLVLTHQSTIVDTRVQWQEYAVPGGPGSQNETYVVPGSICPRSNPAGPVLIAVNWPTSNAAPLVRVRVWTVLPLDTPPFMEIELLFQSNNGTSGSGTFNPVPTCGQAWTVDDDATAATPVAVIASF
jgi:hypothetical protein